MRLLLAPSKVAGCIDWSAERRMSDFGKFARETEPLLFAAGARKAGLPVYATDAQLQRWPDMTRRIPRRAVSP